MSQRQCQYKFDDHRTGQQCKSFAMNGYDYCWYHEPSFVERRKEAAAIGGTKSRRIMADVLPEDTENVKLGTLSEIVEVLEETASQVRRGELSPSRGNTVNAVVGNALKIRELIDLQRSLEEMKEKLKDGDYGDVLKQVV